MKCYNGRKALTRTVNNTKTVLKQLDKFFTSIVIVITILGWLVLVQIATKDLVVLILSQFFVAAFIFGNTCKNIFEAIVFIFVTHPFDVGDCIVVDHVQVSYTYLFYFDRSVDGAITYSINQISKTSLVN